MARSPDDELKTLPAHLQVRPGNKLFWERPTAWLLGTQMVTSLRDILLSSVYEFDPRDWMTAGDPIDLTKAKRPAEPDGEPEGTWIDFLADTGDSPRLVYRLAYLLQQRELEVFDKLGVPLCFDDEKQRLLPRGAALIIGGDTAYPVADFETLEARVRAPFLWARKQLSVEGRLDPAIVPLLGIPGNHDYYNILHGYVRQFRVYGHTVAPGEQLFDIPGYELKQQASYFAVTLSDDWQIWGLDVEMKGLDARQEAYFLSQPKTHSRVVITSKPAIVYHAPSSHADDIEKVFARLGLEPAFLRDGRIPADQVRLDIAGDVHTYERYWGTDFTSDLEAHGAEMPISKPGDEHVGVYSSVERRRREAPVAEERKDGGAKSGNETKKHVATETRANYASVVSGLGGAFHHPAQVRFGRTAPRRSWPPAAKSSRDVGGLLMRPRKVFQAGAVGVAGALVGALCFWLAWLGKGKLNLLDVPLALPEFPPELQPAVDHLVIVLAVIGSLIGFAILTWLMLTWMRFLARPLAPPPDKKIGALLRGWGSLTNWLTHNKLAFWTLRWIGGDRRRSWRILITAPAWLVIVAGILALPALLYWCPHLGEASDGFLPLYILVVVLLGGMWALGTFVGAARHWKKRKRTFTYVLGRAAARILLGLFGFLIGALILWTPYAWTVIVAQADWDALWVLTFFFFWPLRRLIFEPIGFLGWRTNARRAMALLAFALVAVGFVAIPILVVPTQDLWIFGELARPPLRWWGFPFAFFFGGYFACLWLGWYFFICLQWDAHGNEAGGAARVADYAQFLRIKLTKDAAEVWVISAEGPPRGEHRWYKVKPRWKFWKHMNVDDHPIKATLVDHFVVRRTPPAKR